MASARAREKASKSAVPDKITEFFGQPMPFTTCTDKCGERALFSSDSSVVERNEPEKFEDGCVAYTAQPLPVNNAWNLKLLTILDSEEWGGRGLVVGVTTTLPEVAFSLDPDADSNLEIRLLGRHGFSLWSASVKESVSLFPTADGRVYVYFDGVCVKKLETNFPADTQLWGAVDVCRSCVKIKSEILSDSSPWPVLNPLPVKVSLPSTDSAATISPPGLGLTLKVPEDAFYPLPEKAPSVSIQTCPSSSKLFEFPEGYEPLSVTYHISTDSALQKEVDLSIEHNAVIEDEEDAKDMMFCIGQPPTDGSKKITFIPLPGGNFDVGGVRGKVPTRETGFICAGSMRRQKIKKRYALLYSYTNSKHSEPHASIALSLDNEVYCSNFRKAVEKEWNSSASNRSKIPVSFRESSASVSYQSHFRGWEISVDSTPCDFSQETVDNDNPSEKSMYDYPPRYIFNMLPSELAKSCHLEFQVVGLVKDQGFTIPLIASDKNPTTLKEECKPDMIYLETLGDINIVRESANHYAAIGTTLLNDRHGDKLETLKHDKKGEIEIMRAIYKNWLAEDVHYSWETLCDCFRSCQLNSLAFKIEKYVGLESQATTLDRRRSSEASNTAVTRKRSPSSASRASNQELLDMYEHDEEQKLIDGKLEVRCCSCCHCKVM